MYLRSINLVLSHIPALDDGSGDDDDVDGRLMVSASLRYPTNDL